MAKSTPGLSASKGSAQTIPNRGFGSSPMFRPQPRPPFGQFYGSGATNFYRRPSYSYGVPTGLGALLSGQQSPFGRMVDPATGFPQRSLYSTPRPVMPPPPGRPDFGRIGRGKIGMGGAGTVRPLEQEPVMDRQPQPAQIETPSPVRDFTGAPPPRMDASQYLRTNQPIMRSQGPESLRNRVESDLRFGEPGIGRVSQPIMPRPDLIPARPARPVSQTPEEAIRQRALAGNRTGTGLGVTPNIRPTMNVGKATGGPVGIHSGIASLVGRR